MDDLKTFDRFWSKVDKTDTCWLWTRRLIEKGYGMYTVHTRDNWLAHRYSYTLTYGDIPPGMLVCHNCDVLYPPGDITYRRCVRPDHLFIGTSKDNSVDMARKGRWKNQFSGHILSREVVCPDCNLSRVLSADSIYGIRAGMTSGRCQSCAARHRGRS